MPAPNPEWVRLVARVRASDQAALGVIFRAFILPLSPFAYMKRYVKVTLLPEKEAANRQGANPPAGN